MITILQWKKDLTVTTSLVLGQEWFKKALLKKTNLVVSTHEAEFWPIFVAQRFQLSSTQLCHKCDVPSEGKRKSMRHSFQSFYSDLHRQNKFVQPDEQSLANAKEITSFFHFFGFLNYIILSLISSLLHDCNCISLSVTKYQVMNAYGA